MFWKVSTFVLTGALGLTLAYTQVRSAQAEPQPKMQAALAALEVAKTQLENATTDKGGHRKKALDLTKDAIEETKKGIAFDNQH